MKISRYLKRWLYGKNWKKKPLQRSKPIGVFNKACSALITTPTPLCAARHEYETERNAIDALARHSDITTAIAEARKSIAKPFDRPEAGKLFDRIQQLGKALFESIRMQLDVDRYGASGRERGAVLEFLNEPINNRRWLEVQLQKIEDSDSEKTKRNLIQEIVNYECPRSRNALRQSRNARFTPPSRT